MTFDDMDDIFHEIRPINNNWFSQSISKYSGTETHNYTLGINRLAIP